MKKIKKTSVIKNKIIQYISNNSKEYILMSIIFITGIFIGVMCINNCSEEQEKIITSYVSEFVEKFKTIEKIDKTSLLKESIKNNVCLALIIWLAGTTIIGMPIVLGLVLFRGFCLGYTVSAITYAMGAGKSILFCMLGLFLQNMFFIPSILTMGVSSIKLYKEIINNRRKENIKIEIIRHTIISVLMLLLLVCSSALESKIAVELLKFGIKYI